MKNAIHHVTSKRHCRRVHSSSRKPTRRQRDRTAGYPFDDQHGIDSRCDQHSLGEPKGNLLLAVLDRVGAVADVPAHVKGVVTTDGTGGGSERVGGAEHDATGLDGVLALDDDADNGAGKHWVGQLGSCKKRA